MLSYRNGAQGRVGQTLYFGGGTPSLLSLEQMGRIVETLKDTGWISENRGDEPGQRNSLKEFTVEVNPDDVLHGGRNYAEGLRALGVNRISMGVQSFDDAVLKRMGRRHNAAQAIEAYALLREAGFDNISLDFIIGFTPDFDAAKWTRELLSLPGGLPEHLSCYQLSIEEGSGLEKMIERGIFNIPSDEVCEKQYYDICRVLADLGYEHYEISNWARREGTQGSQDLPLSHNSKDPHYSPSPYRSRHNSAYWNHTPYIGFGPGAHSLLVSHKDSAESDEQTELSEQMEVIRRWNNPDVEAYIVAANLDTPDHTDINPGFSSIRGSEILTPEQIREEKIMLGLRTSDGIPAALVTSDGIPAVLLPSQQSLSYEASVNILASVPGTTVHPNFVSAASSLNLVPATIHGNLRISESRWFIADSIISDL